MQVLDMTCHQREYCILYSAHYTRYDDINSSILQIVHKAMVSTVRILQIVHIAIIWAIRILQIVHMAIISTVIRFQIVHTTIISTVGML